MRPTANKKRRFAALPNRQRTVYSAPTIGKPSAEASRGDSAAFCNLVKEILEQGNRAEATATGAWLKGDGETAAQVGHRIDVRPYH